MSGKLYELLAVDADREGISKVRMEETKTVFNKRQDVFKGSTKKTTFFEAEGEDRSMRDTADHHEITTTVDEKLKFLNEAFVNHLNVGLQKDTANQKAVADLVADGTTLAKDLPAVYLLGLEQKFKRMRDVYSAIPTLEVGVAWEADEQAGTGVWRGKHTDIKAKTAKRPMSRILVEPTKEHPAQIREWTEDVQIGKIETTFTSGMLSSKRKSQLLARIDTLIQAAKQARMRANAVDAGNEIIGQTLVDFIHKD